MAGPAKIVNYDLYLEPGETSDPTKAGDGVVLVKPGTLRQRKARLEQHMTPEEREALADERATTLHEASLMRRDDLRWFGESGYHHNAETQAEEIHIHRQFLRNLGHKDVLPGETLRQLATRTWYALLHAKNTRINGNDAWFAGFNPATQLFVMNGWLVKDAARPEDFEAHWKPPAKDPELADEPIDISKLPQLPPPNKKVPVPQAA